MELATTNPIRTVVLDLDELLFYIEEIAADEAAQDRPANPYNMAARLRHYLLDQT